jgi:acyl carrier protein
MVGGGIFRMQLDRRIAIAHTVAGRRTARIGRSTMDFVELRQLMADVFECDPAKITPTSTPDTLEAWDSLRLLDLILAIEQQAQIEISPDRLEEMMSVPAILAIIDEAKAH